jgi:hypothetical protein
VIRCVPYLKALGGGEGVAGWGFRMIRSATYLTVIREVALCVSLLINKNSWGPDPGSGMNNPDHIF